MLISTLSPTWESGWNPMSLFGASDTGLFWDFGVKSSLFQNSTSATTPVVNDGDVVGFVNDLSGRGFHGQSQTDARRGIWRSARGGYVEFDGVDDRLLNLSGPADSAVQTMAWCGRLRSGFSNGGRIIGRSSNRSLQWLTAPRLRYATNDVGTAVNVTGATDPLLPSVIIVRQESATVANVNYNGTQLANFDPNNEASAGFALGLTDVSSFQTQDCSACFLINRSLSNAETAQLKTWMAIRSGATVL
jgi:hypothetical protein